MIAAAATTSSDRAVERGERLRRTLIARAPGRAGGGRGRRSRRWRRRRLDAPAVQRHPLAHPAMPVARRRRSAAAGPRPSSEISSSSASRAQRRRTSAVGRGGVLDRVRQRLLDDPVGAQIERGRDVAGSPSTRRSVGETGRARARDELVEIGEPRLGRQRAGIACRRRAARGAGASPRARRGRRARRAQRGLRALRVGAQHEARAAGLDHHHRDAVRDHVVQLPRDPRPLAVGRRAGAQLALRVEPLRVLAVDARESARPRDIRPAAQGGSPMITRSKNRSAAERVVIRTSAREEPHAERRSQSRATQRQERPRSVETENRGGQRGQYADARMDRSAVSATTLAATPATSAPSGQRRRTATAATENVIAPPTASATCTCPSAPNQTCSSTAIRSTTAVRRSTRTGSSRRKRANGPAHRSGWKHTPKLPRRMRAVALLHADAPSSSRRRAPLSRGRRCASWVAPATDAGSAEAPTTHPTTAAVAWKLRPRCPGGTCHTRRSAS